MPLSSEQRRQYRALAHDLKPVVMVGDKGLSEGVFNELERALNDHELIKVKINVPDKETRKEVLEALCQKTGAEPVQLIGKIGIMLRRAAKPNPRLSNLKR